MEEVLKPDDAGAECGSPGLQESDPSTLPLNTSMGSVPGSLGREPEESYTLVTTELPKILGTWSQDEVHLEGRVPGAEKILELRVPLQSATWLCSRI